MVVEENVDLKKFSHMKVGGLAKKLYRPHSIEDLKWITSHIKGYYILGGGSNILMNDQIVFEHVVFMGDYDKNYLVLNEDKSIVCSASIKIPKLIRFAAEYNLGGIENLITVPALVGGTVVMNAGGEPNAPSISDYIKKVEFVKDGKVFFVDKDACNYSYRNSIFLGKNWIISKVIFQFSEIPHAKIKNKISQKIIFSKIKQDISVPNLGSVFNESDKNIMRFLRYTSFNNQGLYYSRKAHNWISNGGNGDFKQAQKLINRALLLHKLFKKRIHTEWIVWEKEINE
ncbi:MAG: FAD-binding protein [Turicibacter sp.]|nr:FAD-binding protein [Turicibacter sp.]